MGNVSPAAAARWAVPRNWPEALMLKITGKEIARDFGGPFAEAISGKKGKPVRVNLSDTKHPFTLITTPIEQRQTKELVETRLKNKIVTIYGTAKPGEAYSNVALSVTRQPGKEPIIGYGLLPKPNMVTPEIAEGGFPK